MLDIFAIIICLILFAFLPVMYIWRVQMRVHNPIANIKKAGVMLIVKDGLILAISRRHNKNKFSLPGGKVELETIKQAAIRETFEEVGLNIKECEFIFVQNDIDEDSEEFETSCYYATQWSGIPSSSEEGDIRWLSVEELFSELGAFPNYYRGLFRSFKEQFPEIKLIGE